MHERYSESVNCKKVNNKLGIFLFVINLPEKLGVDEAEKGGKWAKMGVRYTEFANCHIFTFTNHLIIYRIINMCKKTY